MVVYLAIDLAVNHSLFIAAGKGSGLCELPDWAKGYQNMPLPPLSNAFPRLAMEQ